MDADHCMELFNLFDLRPNPCPSATARKDEISSVSAQIPGSFRPNTLQQIQTLIKEFLDYRGIQSAFGGFIVDPGKHERQFFDELQAKLVKVLKSANESTELIAAVQHLISSAGRPSWNDKPVDLLGVLQESVYSGYISAKLVCETLLESDRLILTHPKFWKASFSLIQKIISRVDYKGVGVILQKSFAKTFLFSQPTSSSHRPLLKPVTDLLALILDRNANLLPAYCAVDLIFKDYLEKQVTPRFDITQLLLDYVASFQPVAQILTIIGRKRIVPVVGHSLSGFPHINWKLEPTSCRFDLKGRLPYDDDSMQPQHRLLRQIMEQPHSRIMLCSMLGVKKGDKSPCPVFGDILAELVIAAMEKTEEEMATLADQGREIDGVSKGTQLMWQNLSTHLTYFLLSKLTSFPCFVQNIHKKLLDVKLYKGRDFLMWFLLQFVSGIILKEPLRDFIPALTLIQLLYPDVEALPVPSINQASCVIQMAASCLWIVVWKKSRDEMQILQESLPPAIFRHYEYIQSIASFSGHEVNRPPLTTSDFRVALLANVTPTNSQAMVALFGSLCGSTPAAPLSIEMLDSLTVVTGMALIHSIVAHIKKLSSEPESNMPKTLNPALLETYSRLLMYLQLHSFGNKGLMFDELIPIVVKTKSWDIVQILLEMACYRLPHIQPSYRLRLLLLLNTIVRVTRFDSPQLQTCIETTTLRILASFNGIDGHFVFSKIRSEGDSIVSPESEELNRVLVLKLAMAVRIAGSDVGSTGWLQAILAAVMKNTPCNWSSHVLQSFPPSLSTFFKNTRVSHGDKQSLLNLVEAEYEKWKAMIAHEDETELINHFSSPEIQPLFICVVWLLIVSGAGDNPLIPKVLEKIGPKGISANLKKWCDYVTYKMVTTECTVDGTALFQRLAAATNDMVWKMNYVPFDRLLLCLALRNHEGNESQVCHLIIQKLIYFSEFETQMKEFVRDNSPDYWKQSNWNEKHNLFHSKFPEFSYFEGPMEKTRVPAYFGNICLKVLPVFDIIIHRFLEIQDAHKSLPTMLEYMSPLYKFHDYPVTYLYNTLHYYEDCLRNKPLLKKRLVAAILGDPRSINLALSTEYQTYLQQGDGTWQPDTDYYGKLLHRFVKVIEGRHCQKDFAEVDWRFNEHPSPMAHTLHSTCLEILALPVAPVVVGSTTLDYIMNVQAKMDAKSDNLDVECWYNATGLIFSALPEPYWIDLHDRIALAVKKLSSPWPHVDSPILLFNYNAVKNGCQYDEYANILAVTHAVWFHWGAGQLRHIERLITDKLAATVCNEVQLLFITHLVAPFLQKIHCERGAMIRKLALAFYCLLEKVDETTPKDRELVYMDAFCDLLYHMKYVHLGDLVNTMVEPIIKRLRPSLQRRLQFITHLNPQDITVKADSSFQEGQ